MDVHDKATRSFNMSKIKSKDTKPELLVRRFLHSKGLRFRLHRKDLPGKPDIVIPKCKVVIFIQGCFWHGHKNCKYFVVPKTKTEWWLNKINSTAFKDSINTKSLKRLGWRVLQIWECDLKSSKREKSLQKLLLKIDCLK